VIFFFFFLLFTLLYNTSPSIDWVKCGVASLVVDAPIRIEMETMEHTLDGSFYDQSIYDYSGQQSAFLFLTCSRYLSPDSLTP
jgi:hypothetical protein